MEPIKLLIVDDETEYQETYRMLLTKIGYRVTTVSSVDEALKMLDQEYFPIVITDIIMPKKDGFSLLTEIKKQYGEWVQVIVVTGYGSIESAVQAMSQGAMGYCIKSHNPEAFLREIEKAVKLVRFATKQELAAHHRNEKHYLFQTRNEAMKRILDHVDALKDAESNVLISGESGVGKEVIAKLIHDSGLRKDRIFLPVNCQALSDNLLESELFGHEKGAYTGAENKRIGRFEEASGGTIFLDEIGEIAPKTQVSLLRVLDNKYIERLGSNKAIPVDFRLISATNRPLDKAVEEGSFRLDLFYRINTIHLKIPALRERREDLEGLIEFFVLRMSREMKKPVRMVDMKTMEFLLKYQYPGNLRELKNLVERMIVLSNDGILRLDHVEKSPGQRIGKYHEHKLRFEREYFQTALEQSGFNLTKAAECSGLSRRQFFNKVSEHHLQKNKD